MSTLSPWSDPEYLYLIVDDEPPAPSSPSWSLPRHLDLVEIDEPVLDSRPWSLPQHLDLLDVPTVVDMRPWSSPRHRDLTIQEPTSLLVFTESGWVNFELVPIV
jgi:hypothetical protein